MRRRLVERPRTPVHPRSHRGPVYLKSLTIKGFKSFADRAHLALEPGVASIVGPNGSGKSNISDAVLWALGEQSAKTLRGNSMEDVIFAGSSARQAVGVAEVDLVLDNSDGTLPLEFSEVTVTRRMYRNGESEYLLNSSPCRLMDVQDLLHDSGLGRDTHSIISQGRLDEILNSRPEDRRSLIEEAAGVLKHKKRKERALRKLGSMDANLERARDVLAEVERQLRPLQRQADEARQYDSLVSDLRDIEVALAVDDLRALREDWDVLAKEEREHDADIELARYRLTEKERSLGTFQALLEEKGLFVGDLSEQRRRLEKVLERLNSGLLLLEEKGKNLIERLSELRAKVHGAEARGVRRREEISTLSEQRTASDGQLKALYQRLGEMRRESESARKERLAAESSLNETSAAIRRLRKEADDLRADMAKLEQSLSSVSLEQSLLAEREIAIAGQRTALVASLSARRSKLDETERSRAHVEKQIALAESDVDRRVRVVAARRKDTDALREALTRVRAEAIGLEEVDRAFATATPALAWILSSERRVPGLLGPVTDLIKAEPELERAVEMALGSDLFCVLVADAAARGAVLALLSEHSAGDIAVLALDSARPYPVTSNAGRRLSDAIQCSDDVRPAIEAILGDVYLVPSIEEAIDCAQRFSGTRFATAEGHMVWPSGKVTLGPGLDQTASVLERKRRINELHDDEQAAYSRVGEAEAALAEAEEALRAAQQDALELGQQLATHAGDHGSQREEIGRLEAALTDLDDEARSLTARAAAIVDRTAKDGPARDHSAERVEALTAELDRLEEEAVTRRELRDDRSRQETAMSDRLSAVQVDIATVSEREVHLKRQISAAAAELAEAEETLSSAEQTESALELLRERIQPVHDLYAALIERAEGWAVRLRDRARFEQADSESLRATIHNAQDAVREAQAALDERVSALSDVRVAKAQLQVQVDAALARIVDEYGVPIERALEAGSIADREETSGRAHRLRKQLGQIGPVNELAVEEHATLEGRRAYLSSQIDDLASSRAALTKVVRAIDRKMRDRFLETFEQVDAHFRNVFTVLFPGGHAELTMTDPDDPEQTGIEVVAQPQGKKLQKMTLMSGGEKALTALALLFALYRARPCPFYILDEVEAALDDSNLRRFVSFIDTMRAHTQFIVVTHQRRTMEMADVLYGVSMQSDGVSKVVSQRLDRATGRVVDVEDVA
jgi:chromosome segregation protein